jgi:hypothetical protein
VCVRALSSSIPHPLPPALSHPLLSPTPTPPPPSPFQLESPCQITVVNASGYQIRLYGVGSQQAYSNAHIQATSFDAAQGAGFEANFNFISGANSASVKIPMTAPVLIRTNDTYNWDVGFFVPASLYPTLDSIPQPTNTNMDIVPLPAFTTFAVIEFGGFASEDDYLGASANLRSFLARDNITVVEDSWMEAWAGYDAPDVLFNRHNEVWIHVAVA